MIERLLDRFNACNMLLKRNKLDPLLKQMVTGEQRRIIYDSIKWKRPYSKAFESYRTIANPEFTVEKVFLYAWWDWKSGLYCELHPHDQALNYTIFCRSLHRLKHTAGQKHSKKPIKGVQWSTVATPGATCCWRLVRGYERSNRTFCRIYYTDRA